MTSGTLYVTNGAAVAAFDVVADGTTRNQREFARLNAGGNGDGLAIDAEGRLYVTSAAGVQVFSEGGVDLGLIPTPRNVISAAFAGRGKQTLFVVGSGALTADGTEATATRRSQQREDDLQPDDGSGWLCRTCEVTRPWSWAARSDVSRLLTALHCRPILPASFRLHRVLTSGEARLDEAATRRAITGISQVSRRATR